MAPKGLSGFFSTLPLRHHWGKTQGLLMRDTIINALMKNAEGNIALHKANIQVYLDNPAGIGEHSDILEAIQAELDKISIHEDRLDIITAIADDVYDLK